MARKYLWWSLCWAFVDGGSPATNMTLALNMLLDLGRILLVEAGVVGALSNNLLDSGDGLVGEMLVLEHWDGPLELDLSIITTGGKKNSLKASSSRVRPKVSGKKK